MASGWVGPLAADCADAPDWQADAVLASDITPSALAAVPGSSVLLTGATGFLGRHLLRTLLGREAAEVYCLARSGQEDSAHVRVERALADTGALTNGAHQRLRVLAADLSLPNLGLAAGEYTALAHRVSSILHCAADVSWSRPYSKLRNSNVLPVTQLLRFACHGPPKHFALISTLAVCYSTDARLQVAEHCDPSTYLHDIPLGYAQSKAVAERLVREAAGRGLDATIFRPALITGDSIGAHANAEDFVSWLLSGCIRMGHAPDVDWRLDVVPVDFASQAIAANLEPRRGLQTLHIAHPQPRDWRELVLFLNLCGYPVRLEPFDAWRRRLLQFPDSTLPLRRFIGFFTERARGSAGQSVSQVYEAGGQPRISNARSEAHLASQGLAYPQLNAEYFGKFLAVLRRLGAIGAPAQETRTQYRRATLEPAVLQALRPFDPAWQPAHFEASGSITTEIASWRHGGHIGLYGVASCQASAGQPDLILKIKARDDESIATAIEVASIASPRLGQLLKRFCDQLEFGGAGERETALYTANHPVLRERLPRCSAIGSEPQSGRAMLLLERLQNVELLDSVNQPQRWTDAHIGAAIRDLAALHALAFDRGMAAETMFAGVQPFNAERVIEATPLWQALHAFGEPFYRRCGGPELSARVGYLVDDLARWIPAYSRQPATLIHNDCNPRNMAFRRTARGLRTCLYDWELCTLAPPQRDLAELLCFTLDAAHVADRAGGYADLHRRELSRNTGRAIDARSWMQGLHWALAEFMIRRLAMYTMLHAYVRQPFLSRVMRTWQALDQLMRG